MIVPNKFLSENPEKITDNVYNYIVVDATYIAPHIRKKFEYCIEVANVRNTFEAINLIWSDAGSQRKLNVSIFPLIMDAIYTEKPFTEKQLEEYFNLMKDFEDAVDVFQKVGYTTQDVFMDSDVELSLMGLSLSQQYELEKADKDLLYEFHDKFFRLKFRLYKNKIEFPLFKKQVESFIAKLLEEKNNKKKAA